VIVTISLLLVPETLRRVASLHESRVVRGYRFGLRSLPGVMLPLLAEALERSVQRAESLDARGFGSLSSPPRLEETLVSVLSLVGAAIACFLYYYYPGWRIAAAGGVVLGVLGILAVGWRQTRRSRTTRIRRERFSGMDWIVIGGSASATVIIVMCRVFGTGGVTYLPFPSLTAPSFQVIPAAACLLLLSPLLVPREGRR
jgi:energy-coupling factor transport system permease protein